MAIRETFSKFKAVGRLKDKKLEIVDGRFDDGVEFNTVRGRFVIGVENGEYTCEVYMRDKFAGEDHKSNSDFDMVKELQVCGTDTPIEVQIRTNRFNDYVGKSGKIASVDCFNVNRVKILNEPAEEEKFEGAIEGMVTKIVPEYRNEEETGRLLVEVTGVGYGEKALPHALIVDEELADGFKENYGLGSLATFYVEIKSTEYGEKKTTTTGGFGRKADINTGFTRVEWMVIGGEDPVNEEQVNNKGEKLYIDLKDVKNLLEERKVELEQILKESKNKIPKAKGGKQSLKAMATTPSNNNPFEVEKNPFLQGVSRWLRLIFLRNKIRVWLKGWKDKRFCCTVGMILEKPTKVLGY